MRYRQLFIGKYANLFIRKGATLNSLWRCCCSGENGIYVTGRGILSLRMAKNAKNGNYGLNSFNGIDISPSGLSSYLTMDLAFI